MQSVKLAGDLRALPEISTFEFKLDPSDFPTKSAHQPEIVS